MRLRVGVLVGCLAPWAWAVGQTLTVSNAGPLTAGIRRVMRVVVESSPGMVETNRHARAVVRVSSASTKVEPSEFLVVRGRAEETFYLKETGAAASVRMTVRLEGGPVIETNLAVLHPGEAGDRRALLVNELMPHTSADPLYEWVEFYNNADAAVSLTNLHVYVYDRRSTSSSYFYKVTASTPVHPAGPLVVQPGGYAVMVRSMAAFRSRYPEVWEAVAAGAEGYERTLIFSSEYGVADKHSLSSTGGTVYVASNNALDAPLVTVLAYGDWGIVRDRSLERVSPDVHGHEPSNWRVSSGLGSPGRRNDASVTRPALAVSAAKPLTVDASDAAGDVRIRLSAPEALEAVRVQVMSSAGRSCRVLADGLTLAKGDEWGAAYDRRNDQGIPLARGLYLVVVTGRAKDGRPVRYAAAFVVRGTGP